MRPKTKKNIPEFINSESMDKFYESDIFEDTFQGTRDKLIIEIIDSRYIKFNQISVEENLKVIILHPIDHIKRLCV